MIRSKLIFAGVLCAVLGVLAGCATTRGDPPADTNEALAQVAVQTAIAVAVDRTVTRGDAPDSIVAERAGRIVLVVDSLKALGADSLSTLPQINAALAPLLDRLNLPPFERNQANLLVSALVSVGLKRVDASKYVAEVAFILDEVARDAAAYLPAASPSG